ncbi:MAG: DUF5680 domain-containing protein, partial [Candidatus Micrarchaeia archaeon]
MVLPSKSQLRTFLYSSHLNGYSSGNRGTLQKDGSRTVAYSKGNWEYQDNYFGGNPFGGREVVFFNGKPLYLMSYYGALSAGVVDIERVFCFLRKALCGSPKANPYRGPKSFCLGSLAYRNNWSGSLSGFSGEEAIWRMEIG